MKARKNNRAKIRGFRWVHVIGTLVVVGSTMAFGSIVTVSFNLDRNEAINMIGMVPIMTAIYYLSMKPVIKMLSSRIDVLINAMDQVTNGDLDVQINVKKAGEFEKVYTQFNAMTMELKRTKEEMNSFVNEFAHEFKTPITAISGFSEYLLETADGIETNERIKQLEMINAESSRLLNLSMNTLLVSKVDAMQVVENQEKYDLAEQLRKCVILLCNELDKKNIELEMDEDLELPYLGNEELLQHVFLNILSNAIKFTPEGGTITISGKRSGDKVSIRIADSGIGMDLKTMERIFEKYYQNDTSSIAKGSGIGLYIVKRIVELCNGTIDVNSELGKGTVFTVCL